MVRFFKAPLGQGGQEECLSTEGVPSSVGKGNSTLGMVMTVLAFVVMLSGPGFAACAIHNEFKYDNWRGAYPLENSVEITNRYLYLANVLDQNYDECYAEFAGSSLHILRQESGNVLVEYRTPRVTESSAYTYCADNARLVMSVREWNSTIRQERQLQEERDRVERARQEAIRRLTSQPEPQLQDSLRLTDDYRLHYLLNGSLVGCWPEETGASLHILRRDGDRVLVEYRTPRVTESSTYTYCADNARLVMSVREWTRFIEHEQRVRERRAQREAVERLRQEAAQRLTR